MDNLQMDEMLARLRQHKRTIAELKQAAEAIEAEIKAELTARGVDVLETPRSAGKRRPPPGWTSRL